MEQRGIKMYARGKEPNPFSCRTFCGDCGKSYTSHFGKNRGIQQWQCKGHRTNEVLTCRNTFVNHENLKKGFVVAYNKMMDLSGQEPLTGMVDELVQLIITEITILGAKNMSSLSKVKAAFLFAPPSILSLTICQL